MQFGHVLDLTLIPMRYPGMLGFESWYCCCLPATRPKGQVSKRSSVMKPKDSGNCFCGTAWTKGLVGLSLKDAWRRCLINVAFTSSHELPREGLVDYLW